MKKIAILASGEGTNAERIIRYFLEKRTAEVALVIVNKAQAGVLKRAERLSVPSLILTAQDLPTGKHWKYCTNIILTLLYWQASS